MVHLTRSSRLALLSVILQHVVAAPAPAQLTFDARTVGFNPLDHMSGISPYHDAPGASMLPPHHCNVTAAAFLIRHSCICANDDEYEEFMAPFIAKVVAGQSGGSFSGALDFLDTWESPVTDDNLEELTKPGISDAEDFGKRMRALYGPLFPSKHLGKESAAAISKKKKGKVTTPFKVFTASSDRDIGTAKAWIRGAFPHWQEGDGGEGDGKFVSLVKVPNKDPNWAGSLTPHKICPAFTKEAGKPEAQQWLETFGPAPLARMQKLAPHLDLGLNDVIAAFMLCGYESVILPTRTSRFCAPELFEEHEFHSFGYWNDLKYHYQVGYGSPVSPYLGMGWLNTSTHNLLTAFDNPHPHFSSSDLPPPDAPPDTEHTQLFFPYFTHREEPPVALVALGLWNTSYLSPTEMDHSRKWKTSRVLPFLGHVALERISCSSHAIPADTDTDTGADGEPRADFVRVVVNGAVQTLDACQDGPGGSCPLKEFGEFVAERVERWGDFEKGCAKED